MKACVRPRSFLRRSIAATVVLAALPLMPPLAEEIQQWTDEDGRLHFSNRPPSDQVVPGAAQEPGASDDAGVAEEAAGDAADVTRSFVAAADSIINSLEAEIVRRKRLIHRGRSALEAARNERYRIQEEPVKDPSVPVTRERLRLEEQQHLQQIRSLEAEVAGLEEKIKRLTNVKLSGSHEIERLSGIEP